MSSKWPNEARVQVSNLLNCVIMCDVTVDFSFYDVDDLAMMASDLLDQFRKRGMPDSIHRRVLDTAHPSQTNNLEKLKGAGPSYSIQNPLIDSDCCDNLKQQPRGFLGQ